MNAPVDHDCFQSHSTNANDFHVARSECIDAFAILETAVYRLSATLKIEPNNKGQFSQAIKALKAEPASPQLSKERVKEIKACCEEVTSLLGRRADIVHSTMNIIDPGPDAVAIFRNAVSVSAGSCQVHAYDLGTLSALASNARNLARRFDTLRSPPSTKISAS